MSDCATPRKKENLANEGLVAALRFLGHREPLLLWTWLGMLVASLGIAGWLVFLAPNSPTLKIAASSAVFVISVAQHQLIKHWKEKQTTLRMDLDDEQKALKYIESLINAKAKN